MGGAGDDSGRGASWVFTRSGSIWSQQGAKLVGSENVGQSNQGVSVSMSADGNTVIVGGFADNGYVGAAWIFTRSSSSTWTQQGAKLVGSGYIGSSTVPNQGFSVSLSADGNVAILGGPGDDGGKGAVWVFTRSGSTWNQQAKLVGTGGIGINVAQGWSVSLSADGNTAIVGGSFDDYRNGATWVFTRNASIWSQQGAKLVGTGAINGTNGPYGANQGWSVSVSADGNMAIVGGCSDNYNKDATWVYIRNGSTWTQQGAKHVGTGSIGTNVSQGYSVSLSADGNTAIEGGLYDNSNQGAAWIFTSSFLAPVKMLSFTGERQATNNLLHWATASEQNNKGFELQRATKAPSNSPQGGEPPQFAAIAFVPTKASGGNSTSKLSYAYTDEHPPSGGRLVPTGLWGGAFYRLRQIDNDGKETLSNIVFIRGEMGKEMILCLSPNPTTKHFTLTAHSTNTQPVSIKVLDAVGKMVYATTGHAEQPFIFGEKLPNGLYIIEAKQGDDVKKVKAVKGM